MTNNGYRRWSPTKFATVWRRHSHRGAARRMAEALSVHDTTVHRWVVKLDPPPQHWWGRIAKHLGVTVEDLTAKE